MIIPLARRRRRLDEFLHLANFDHAVAILADVLPDPIKRLANALVK